MTDYNKRVAYYKFPNDDLLEITALRPQSIFSVAYGVSVEYSYYTGKLLQPDGNRLYADYSKGRVSDHDDNASILSNAANSLTFHDVRDYLYMCCTKIYEDGGPVYSHADAKEISEEEYYESLGIVVPDFESLRMENSIEEEIERNTPKYSL